MATPISHVSADKGLKTLYTSGQKMQRLMYGTRQREFFNKVKKNTEFAGRSMPFPVYWSDASGGRSADMATAQANRSSIQVGEFNIDVVENHSNVEITTQMLWRARKDLASFLKTQEIRVDTALNVLLNDIETGIWSEKSGWLAQVKNTSFATTALELVDKKHAKKFAKDQVIRVSATKTGSLRTGSLTVDKTNKATGVVTTTVNLSTGIAAIATNDYIFIAGDAADGSGTGKKISGIPEWIPAADPTGGDNHFGQDRSVAVVELSGVRTTGSLSAIKKAIRDNAQAIADFGDGAPDHAWCSYQTFGLLVDELDQDVVMEPGQNGTVGFQYVTVWGPRGPIRVTPATKCQEKVVFNLQQDTWELVSMGDAARINDDDGKMLQRSPTSPGVEVRGDSHAQLRCDVPGFNGRVDLT